MKPIRLSQFLNGLTVLLFLSIAYSGLIPAQERLKDERHKDKSAWENLSPEDQKKLKEALRKVWSDPRVLSARENVNRSAREYQQAVRATIAKQDPETAKLLDRIQKSQSGMLHTVMGGPRKKPGMGMSGQRLTQVVAPPHMMDKMTDEQKKLFREAELQAKEDPEVVQAIEELRKLSKEDEAIRAKKLEAYRNFRRTYFGAITRINPELKEFIPVPGSSPLPFGGKGKGIRPGKRPPGPE